MNKKLYVVTILIFICLTAFALTGSNGLDNFEVTYENSQQIDLNFAVDNFEIAEETVDGVTYQRLENPNAGYITERGNPELPTFSALIKVPNTGKINISVNGYEEIKFQDLNLYPSQGTYQTDRGPVSFAKNDATYNSNKFFKTPIAEVSEPAIFRDYRVVSVTVFPIKYNPNTKETYLRKNISVTVNFSDEKGINELTSNRAQLKSRSFENLYASSILNYVPTREANYQEKTLVIIYPEGDTDVENIVHHLYEWKREKGFNTILAGSSITGTSATSIKAYLQDGYDTWENRPEYILIIGDPNQGSVTVPASGTNGDHHYTELVGTDYLPDAFVGRLSVANPTQLMTVWNKIKFYEKMPYLGELDWYRTHLLVGDSAHSGTSTYYTNLYIHDVMADYDANHSFIELYNGAPNVGEMNTALTGGVNLFNYRGYIGMSGWGISHINNDINNGMKLINSVIITCDTGSFASSYGESRTEAFIRVGTPNDLKGAVSCVGMATSGTNTRFNNALNGGMFHALYKAGANTIGEATALGKVYLHQTYWWDSNHGGPAAFVTWLNQMGDPSMDIWKTQPSPLVATYNSSVEKGTNFLDVHVTKISGTPLEGAWVTARQVGDAGIEEILFDTHLTDANGDVRLNFEADNPGTVKLTVTMPQYIPHLGTFTVEDAEMVNIETVIVDDDNDGESQGNDNGEINSGETIELTLELKNYLATNVNNVQAELTTDDSYFNVVQSQGDFGNIVSESSAEALFVVEISHACPDFYRGSLTLDITTDEGNYTNAVFFDIKGTDLEIRNIVINDSDNNILDPGEIANIDITVLNNGSVDLESVYGELISSNGLLMVNDNISEFGDIAIQDSVTNATNSFQIQAHAQLIPGMKIPFDVRFYNAAGYEEIEHFEISIGSPNINDPTGPDEYGYFIFDDEDTSHPLYCPTYEWIEIDPSFGGNGIDTEMSDTAEDDDKNISLNLPFTFNFYGEARNEIVICTNGWVSFSDTDQSTFRNWIVPGPLGPTRMIAAFWDDLQTTSTDEGGVFTQYLDDQHIFVIEWSKMESRQTGAENTFQVLLYDPNFYPTSLGDGQIKIQYKVVHNDDTAGGSPLWTGGNYCTVGIENATSDIGLQYTFSNEYDANAKPLEDEMAIAFFGPPVSHEEAYLVLGNQVVVDENGNGIVEAGEHIQLGIRLSNLGEADAVGAVATLTSLTPYATLTNAESNYGPITGGQSLAGYEYFELDIAETIPDDVTIDFQVNITLDDQSWEYYFNFMARKAALEYDTFVINDSDGNADGIPNNGETVTIGIVLKNPNLVMAQDVVATITTDADTLATVIDGDLDFGNIAGQSHKMQLFQLAIDADAEDSAPINMTLTYSGTGINPPAEILTIQVNMSSLFNDFEDDNGDYTGSGSWAWGAGAQAYSGTNVWATGLNTDYPSGSNARVHTPEFLISGAADLSFWHWYHIENSWDGGQVQISTNGGSSWELLTPSNMEYSGTANSSNPLTGPVFCGTHETWEEVLFDLSPYVGQEVMIGWVFGSDSSVTYDGWFIDDVLIGGVSADFGGLVSGTVTLSDDNDVQDVVVESYGLTTSPTADGTYAMILPEGTADVTAFLPFYTATMQDTFTVSVLNPVTGIDFSLFHIASPDSLIYELFDYQVSLDWEFDNMDDEDFVNFEIFRRIDTDTFIQVATSTEPHFQQTLANDHTYAYYILAQYENGASDHSNQISFFLHVGNDDDNAPALVTELGRNYPNPFNPTTNIAFSLAEPSDVSIQIYNIKGQLVKTLKNEHMDAGHHNVVWYGKDNNNKSVSTGVYFYKMHTDSYNSIKKALLMK